jgi:RNA recognition motif-containing protein
LVKKLYVGNLGAGNLYVGNLPAGFTSRDLQKLLEPHGTVHSAEVVKHGDPGRSRRFGFVTMGSEQEAEDAIAALGDRDLESLTAARGKEAGGRR